MLLSLSRTYVASLTSFVSVAIAHTVNVSRLFFYFDALLIAVRRAETVQRCETMLALTVINVCPPYLYPVSNDHH